MTKRTVPRLTAFAAIFIVTLGVTAFCLLQLKPDNLSLPAGYLAADKGYGVTVNLTQYNDDALPNTLANLRQNGLLWLRQPVNWADIESTPGQFNWQPLDDVFDAVDQTNSAVSPAQQIKLIAVLHTSPAWARPPNTSPTTPPKNSADFGRFAQAVTERYGSRLTHYQIWHEPNLSENWGGRYVNPQAYAQLLREAALQIRAANPAALILTAALAPTRETGPLNLNEPDFLAQLYQAKADEWFDIVAGQPYGFDFDPSHPANPDTLNFSRLELLRQVMLQYGDADTPIWATAFGWNALPDDWAGKPSPWRNNQQRVDPPSVQAQRTVDGLQHARQKWPWLGPMLAIRWDSANLTPDDPTHGFALSETPLILDAVRQAATANFVATPGNYPANHPGGQYSSGWRTALTVADAPPNEPATLTIPFNGTRLDLTVNRGDYRGYLWVTVDGQPANALPQNSQGRSYVVLYDPLRNPETVTLAENLLPGKHVAVIQADGGWGQWAIARWAVSNQANTQIYRALLPLAAVLTLFSGLALLWQLWPWLAQNTASIAFWSGWRKYLLTPYIQLGDWGHTAILFGLAAAFYFAPANLALVLLVPLALCIMIRPDLGLALIAFSFSFFQAPKQLPIGTFLLTESTLLLAAVGFVIRKLVSVVRVRVESKSSAFGLQNKNPVSRILHPKSQIPHLTSLDWAALALLALGLLSTLTASNFGVSLHQWRLLIFGSVLYYFLVRLGKDYGPNPASPLRWSWRLLDALVAGASVHALVALTLYFSGDQSSAVTGPFYGSPNNLALYLGRVWPILLAVAVLPSAGMSSSTTRRWIYGAALLPISLALLLTASAGALLLAVPVSVIAMALFYLLRRYQKHRGRIIAIAGGGFVLLIVLLIPLSLTQRFRSLFGLEQGASGYTRLKLWQASLNMLGDYWPTGVGLNNFLYQYRTRYVLPEAWQEPELSHPHNIILDFGLSLGLGGAAILVWLQVAFWQTVWRLYKRVPEPFVLGLVGSMAAFLSHGLIDNSYFLVDLAFSFFLIVGVVQGLSDKGE